MNKTQFTYQRHKPEETILYQTIAAHVDQFFAAVGSDETRKPLPAFVRREFDKYLACGILSHGFVRVKCSECRESMVCGFSCKCRGFCPSCASRRMSERSIHLMEQVLPWVPMRQWVLSVPFELRYWMAADNTLLKKVNRIVIQEVDNYVRKRARKMGFGACESGYVSFLQRAGGSINTNLHWHILAIDGFYTGENKEDLCFHRLSELKDGELQKILSKVTRRVIKYLRKIGKIPPVEGVYDDVSTEDASDDTLSAINAASVKGMIAFGDRAGQRVRRIGRTFGHEGEKPLMRGYLCASMNGFSIHAATSIKDYDRHGLEKLIRYMGRGAISLERFSLNEKGDILYQLKNAYDGASQILLSPMELMEKLCGLIPPSYKHQVTYYGCLSSHSSLRPLIILESADMNTDETVLEKETTGADQNTEKDKGGSLDEEKTKNSNYIDWQTLLKKVFKIDISVCPKCQGRMRVIAVINEKKIINKILAHMGLGSDPPPVSPSRFFAEDIYLS